MDTYFSRSLIPVWKLKNWGIFPVPIFHWDLWPERCLIVFPFMGSMALTGDAPDISVGVVNLKTVHSPMCLPRSWLQRLLHIQY